MDTTRTRRASGYSRSASAPPRAASSCDPSQGRGPGSRPLYGRDPSDDVFADISPGKIQLRQEFGGEHGRVRAAERYYQVDMYLGILKDDSREDPAEAPRVLGL